MRIDTSNINTLWSSLIVEELIRNGLDYFCVSPGSRSAPLAIAVARNPRAKSIIWYDERGAAFHALGYARATRVPAPLICTSGTAVANYLPAVIEADANSIPMLILAADRPPELRQTGANQTINQPNIFNEYVRWKFDMPCPDEKIPPEVILTTADQAVFRSRRSPAGPVYLNCMFREPLAPINDSIQEGYHSHLTTWEKNQRPFTRYEYSLLTPSETTIREVAATLNQTERGIIVIGRLESDADREAARRFGDTLNMLIFPDITSHCRLGPATRNIIPYFDHVLLDPQVGDMARPDTVLHIGGNITSKRFLEFLEKKPIKNYIVVKNHPFRHDPIHAVTTRIEADICTFCNCLLPRVIPHLNSHWQDEWIARTHKVKMTVDEFFRGREEISEPGVAYCIAQNIPENHGLFLGNSMPVRDMDMYGATDGAAVGVAANRGASGIDGLVASATGFMVGLNSPVTLLIGDLALLHDLSSLCRLTSIYQRLIIVVLNNHGGGIFSFLPVSQFEDVFESYFGTAHEFGFDKIAENFDLNYYQPKTNKAFLKDYTSAIGGDKSALIEIKTDRQRNWDLHQTLQATIIKSLIIG
ncbi:MAG: 2-succinyl-5-enolpyruvyl-6-hydroxy-3-cyclohexene-1-carboxylic-acid synthase [bacterium]